MERLAQQPLGRLGAVGVGSVEELDAEVGRAPEEPAGAGRVRRVAPCATPRERHRAESEPTHREVGQPSLRVGRARHAASPRDRVSRWRQARRAASRPSLPSTARPRVAVPSSALSTALTASGPRPRLEDDHVLLQHTHVPEAALVLGVAEAEVERVHRRVGAERLDELHEQVGAGPVLGRGGIVPRHGGPEGAAVGATVPEGGGLSPEVEHDSLEPALLHGELGEPPRELVVREPDSGAIVDRCAAARARSPRRAGRGLRGSCSGAPPPLPGRLLRGGADSAECGTSPFSRPCHEERVEPSRGRRSASAGARARTGAGARSPLARAPPHGETSPPSASAAARGRRVHRRATLSGSRRGTAASGGAPRMPPYATVNMQAQARADSDVAEAGRQCDLFEPGDDERNRLASLLEDEDVRSQDSGRMPDDREDDIDVAREARPLERFPDRPQALDLLRGTRDAGGLVAVGSGHAHRKPVPTGPERAAGRARSGRRSHPSVHSATTRRGSSCRKRERRAGCVAQPAVDHREAQEREMVDGYPREEVPRAALV